MAKQKIVLRVTMEDAKRRSKALKTAVSIVGVISAQLDGDKIVVVGEGIDSVALVLMLRKRMGFAELASVAAVEEKKEEKKKEPEKGQDQKNVNVVHPMIWPHHQQPYNYMWEPRREPNYYDDPSCSIM